MGWERKRGKLHELNRLLRGATDTTFIDVGGRPPAVPAGRPLRHHARRRHAAAARGGAAAGRQDGASAQPAALRSAHAAASSRATRVLQPRVTPSLPIGREGSLFQRVFSEHERHRSVRRRRLRRLSGPVRRGLLHRQGHLRRRRLRGRARRPRAREHAAQPRPVRGHLRPRRPGLRHRGRRGVSRRATTSRRRASTAGRAATGSCCRGSSGAATRRGAARGAMPLIGRWKMLDNLRRSLSAPASVARAGRGLDAAAAQPRSSGPASSWRRSRCRRCCRCSPRSCRAAPGITAAQPPARARRGPRGSRCSQTALLIAFLAHQAWLMARCDRAHAVPAARDAAGTCSSGSRRRRPASARRLDLAGFYRRMGGGVADRRRRGDRRRVARARRLAGGGAVRARCGSPRRPSRAGASRSPPVAGRVPVSAADARALRLVARRTWRFFETFVTAADHMLPPDNFQEDPQPVVAHRTSPTNLGLYLLSAVSARDFGWIGTAEAVERLEATLATMGGLAALPRPLLQLVRHARSAAARPALRLVGGQRQSGRTPDRAGERLPGVERPTGGRAPRSSPASTTRCSSRARRCRACPTTGGRRRSRGSSSAMRSMRWRPRCSGHRCPPTDIGARLAELAPHAATMADIARTLASERGDDAGAEMLFWAEATLRVDREPPPRRAPQWPTPRTPWSAGSRRSRRRRERWRSRWSSASCSTRSASCSRSATGSPTARSIRAATTCSPPRRAWRASSRSPRATCRRGTGSGSGAP